VREFLSNPALYHRSQRIHHSGCWWTVTSVELDAAGSVRYLWLERINSLSGSPMDYAIVPQVEIYPSAGDLIEGVDLTRWLPPVPAYSLPLEPDACPF